jgi:hypothetical protein
VSAGPRKIPGVIRADEAYELGEFARRMRLGEFALREVRQKGLRVISVGRRRYVRGADWLEFLDRVTVVEVAINSS